MSDYRDYRFRIHPAGPIGTPWQSDTLFGHLAWLVAMQEGDSALNDYLRPFQEGAPPFILSDGFPGDLLPVPLLEDTFKPSHSLSPGEYALSKERKKARYLTEESFQIARCGRMAKEGLRGDPFTRSETLHARLSRHTNATGEEGKLFSTVESYLPEKAAITIYSRCLDGWGERLRELLERLSLAGYGRDKSTGIGAFSLESMDEYMGFSPLDGANGFISLSTFVPEESDPTEGKWKLRVKRGFLGEQAGNGNPFKRPLLQFEPGAAFHTVGQPMPWYGRLVTGIAPGMPEAVQNCQTIAVPCRFSIP